MLESWLDATHFWFKGWHFAVGRSVCAPIADWLPPSLAPHCPRFVDGFFTTLELVMLALVCAFVLATRLTAWLQLGPRWAKRPIRAYVYVFQGTPLLIQLWLVYYGLAQFVWVRESMLWIFLQSGWWVGLLILILNSAAYQTQILQGAIQTLPTGQHEGALALGLNEKQRFRHILAPQGLRAAWPALANEAILLLKASALVSTITVYDLMGHSRTVFSRSYDLWVYGGAAVLYIVLTALITLIAYGIRRQCFAALPDDPWFKRNIR